MSGTAFGFDFDDEDTNPGMSLESTRPPPSPPSLEHRVLRLEQWRDGATHVIARLDRELEGREMMARTERRSDRRLLIVSIAVQSSFWLAGALALVAYLLGAF